MVKKSEKNVCLRLSFLSTNSFATSAKFMLSRIFLWTCTNVRACSQLFPIVYKKTDERYIEWQWVTTNDNEWQRMTMSDSEWQRVTTSGTTSDNEWQRMVQRVTTNDNEWQQMTVSDSKWKRVIQRVTTNGNDWQQMTMSDNEWQKVVQRVKMALLLQRMDDCNFSYNKNRYSTSRDGWLILQSLNRVPLTSSKKVAGVNK